MKCQKVWAWAMHWRNFSEMFPLLDESDDADNTLELFQIWVNLAAADKMTDPHFSMLWDHTIPRYEHTDENGQETVVHVIAGKRAETLAEELFVLMTLGDDRAIAQTYVAGRPRKPART